MRELDVVGVRVEMPSNNPMVLLREVGGVRYLPIWIGASEASAIANAQEGVVPPRPMTHDLMVDTLTTMGHRLTEIRITELTGGTFYAVLLVDGVEISARPSDAIALALRVGSDIYCAEDVLDEAGIEMPEQEEDEVEKFREFLDQVNPDDFVTGDEPKACASPWTRRVVGRPTAPGLSLEELVARCPLAVRRVVDPASGAVVASSVRANLLDGIPSIGFGEWRRTWAPATCRARPGDSVEGSDAMADAQGLLFDGDFYRMPANIGFRGPIACNAAGITYRQLDYWARTGLVVPEVRGASGSGSQRLYSFRDVLLLKVIKRLLDAGISLNQIRTAIEHLRARGVQDLTEVTLMSDGVSVFECTSDDEVIDLLRGGQGVFGIALGGVWRDIEGTLLGSAGRTGRDPRVRDAAPTSADDELTRRRRARAGG